MRKKVWLILVISIVVFSGGSFAREMTWIDADPADHLWDTAGNWWDPNTNDYATTVPDATDNVYFNLDVDDPVIATGVTAVCNNFFGPEEQPHGVEVNMTGGSLQINGELYIGANDTSGFGNGSPGIFNLSGGTLTQPGSQANIGGGVNGDGILNISGGSATFNHLTLAQTSGSTGEVVVNSGGTLTTTNGETWIGENSTAVMTINGGTANLSNVRVAPNHDGDGTVYLNDGTLDAQGTMFWLANHGTAAMTIDGGTLTNTGLLLMSHSAGSESSLTVDSGSIDVTSEIWVGHIGTATLTVNGGTVTTTGVIKIPNDTGTGHVNVTGGSINGPITTGNGGSGTMTIDGGDIGNITPNAFWLGVDGNGTVNLNSGSIATSQLLFGHNVGGEGTLTVSGGSVSANETLMPLDGKATLVLNDGTVVLDGTGATAALRMAPNASSDADMVVNGGTLTTTNGETWIGENNTAVMTINGGTANLRDVRVGTNHGGDGTINLNGGIIDGQGTSFWLANNGTATMTIDGGTLTNAGHILMSHSVAGESTLTVNSGSIDIAAEIWVGHMGTATLTVNGGTVTTTSVIRIPNNTGTGHVQLDDGVLNVTGITMRQSGGTGTIDITEGKMVLPNNWTSTFQGWVDDGWITAYNNPMGVLISYDSITNTTTVQAVGDPDKAYGPTPEDGSTPQLASNSIFLEWNAALTAVSHHIYFGDDFDDVDNATTSTPVIYRGSQPLEDANYPVTDILINTTYYWRIDEVDGSSDVTKGDIWEFTTDCVTASPLAGDFNSDCTVDVDDLNIFLLDWLDDHLLAKYTLDETSGTIATDSSGNGYDGTVTGSTYSWNPTGGQYDGALDFNGNDRLVVNDDVLSAIDGEITITIWQNGDAAVQPQVDYCFDASLGAAPQTSILRFHIPHGDGLVYWDAGGDDPSSYDRTFDTPNASDYKGQWNFWAFTKNVSTGTMKIYLNGQLWHSEIGKVQPMIGNTGFAIGARYIDNVGEYYEYDGLIDDFRIYNVELTEAEINNVMADSTQVLETDLVGDGQINLADFAAMATNWLQYNGW